MAKVIRDGFDKRRTHRMHWDNRKARFPAFYPNRHIASFTVLAQEPAELSTLMDEKNLKIRSSRCLSGMLYIFDPDHSSQLSDFEADNPLPTCQHGARLRYEREESRPPRFTNA